MNQFVSLWIGFRFYVARQSNRFISFISFASTAGIALGVAVLIVVLSAMNGFEQQLQQRLLGIVAQGELTGVEAPLENWQKIVASAQKIKGIEAAAPFITMQGLVQRQGGFHGLTVFGIDPALEAKVSTLPEFVKPDVWQALEQAEKNNILLGASLAKKFNLQIGDKLSLFTPAHKSKGLAKPKSHQFVIAGFYDVGGEIEQTTAYISLAHASNLLDMQDNVSGVRIKVDNVFDAPRLIRELGYSQQQYMYISDWTRTQGHLYQDIQLVRMIMYIVLALVIAVACFNIVSTLVMAVRDKESEIAILMTMGMKRASIMMIFMVQGAFNGLLGCGLGGLIGTLVAANLSAIAKGIESIFGVQLLSGDIYFIDFLPSQLQLTDVVAVIGLAFVMSLIATIYPAWKASHTAPARALAGGS
ncbi:lipoprotein-releasing ABC transporter permease subunit LolE [Shewanella gelidii]|nr:lipoprotein-releasing ABC transporter permease subunit LolE [Shewanella gelidii]MCL1097546.1 lipoprotein-releasing ABC transporter permease subunit LolE [Shewanella gelidii]